MINIKNLDKSYSDKEVLSNVSLTINDGSILGLVGINGAGKSTLLRLLSGIFKPDFGHITFDGQEVFENENVKKDIFFLPDEPFYQYNETPISLLELYKAFYKVDESVYNSYLSYFKIPLRKSLHNFSKGMKRQVFISLALAIKPKYLFLDEAFDGLDPIARLAVKRALIDLVIEKKTTVIISSHSLRELEDICDCYALIDNKTISSNGLISDNLEKYHKYQIAFNNEYEKEDFDIDFISFNKDKRIIKVVSTLAYEEFSKQIEKYKPLIIDEIPIDFEELFIIEVESKGYLKWETYLNITLRKDGHLYFL